jgi:hypothetical protein
LTGRSHQRPCGAGTQTSRMAARASAYRRLGRLASRRTTRRQEGRSGYLIGARAEQRCHPSNDNETSSPSIALLVPLVFCDVGTGRICHSYTIHPQSALARIREFMRLHSVPNCFPFNFR